MYAILRVLGNLSSLTTVPLLRKLQVILEASMEKAVIFFIAGDRPVITAVPAMIIYEDIMLLYGFRKYSPVPTLKSLAEEM